MLYILTLLCNIRSFNALIIIKLEYSVLALPDPDIILVALPRGNMLTRKTKTNYGKMYIQIM